MSKTGFFFGLALLLMAAGVNAQTQTFQVKTTVDPQSMRIVKVSPQKSIGLFVVVATVINRTDKTQEITMGSCGFDQSWRVDSPALLVSHEPCVNKNSRKRIAAGNQYGIHLFPLNDRTIAAIKILYATGSKKAPKIVGPSLLAIDPSIKSVAPRNTNKIKAAQYDIGL